jgi:hypothetical protein
MCGVRLDNTEILSGSELEVVEVKINSEEEAA